jgi:acetyltransferase-like isoleucine patch superfamily enzyme
MNISYKAKMSFGVKLDKTNPRGIIIKDGSFIAYGAIILTHDYVRGLYKNTIIGENTFIGVNSIIMPGIEVCNNSIVAAGSIVTKDVPANSIVAGNPAKIIKSNINTTTYGKLIN